MVYNPYGNPSLGTFTPVPPTMSGVGLSAGTAAPTGARQYYTGGLQGDPPDRQPYTGALQGDPTTPQIGDGSGRPVGASDSQLAGRHDTNAVLGPQSGPGSADDPYGRNETGQGMYAYNPLLGGMNEANQFGGQLAQAMYAQGASAQNRAAPQLNTGAVNMFASGVGNKLNEADTSNLGAAKGALQLSDTANGAAQQGQMGAANALMGAGNGQAVNGQLSLAQQLQALGQAPAGPSVAQQQLLMGADQAMKQQLALAAGARGSNAGLALQNAGQNLGAQMGQLNQQQALLRAQEDLNNRQMSAQALQAAANTYGNAGALQGNLYQGAGQAYGGAAGTQQNAYGGSANIFQGIAGNQVGQANTGNALAGIYAGMASDQGKLGLGQNTLNDAMTQYSQQAGFNALNSDRDAWMQYMAQNQNAQGQQHATDTQAAVQSQLGNRQLDQQSTGAMISGIASTAAMLLPLLFSDMRAKKNVVPAEGDVSDTFRTLGAYGYNYTDPRMGQGKHFGPMAQELEQTPAGASVVTDTPKGKAVDPGRLAMLNASETARLRQELDALKAQAGQIQGTQVAYPGQEPELPPDDAAARAKRYRDDRKQYDASLLSALTSGLRSYGAGFSRPVTYPTPSAPSYGYGF